jgi:hypothetical protein
MKSIFLPRRRAMLISLAAFAHINLSAQTPAHADKPNFDWLAAAGEYMYVTVPTKFVTEVECWRDGKVTDTGKLEIYLGDFPKENDGNGPKTLVRFTEDGVRKGRLILYEGERAWMYFRGTNQAIRVPLAEELIGDADVASILNIDLRTVYTVTSVTDENSESLPTRVSLELSDKTGKAPYASATLVLDSSSYRPLKVDFRSLSGKLIKTVEYLSFQPFQGRHVLQSVRITAHLNEKSDFTLINYVSVQKHELPRRMFTPALLKDF